MPAGRPRWATAEEQTWLVQRLSDFKRARLDGTIRSMLVVLRKDWFSSFPLPGGKEDEDAKWDVRCRNVR